MRSVAFLFLCSSVFSQIVDYKNVRYVPAVGLRQFQFQLSSGNLSGGSLSTAGAKSLTVKPCPQGVGGADVGHYVRISGGTGTAETVLITGGTCTGGASSGTLAFTTVNTHTGSYRIASATAGLQEAWNAGSTSIWCEDGIHILYATARTGARDTTLRGTANCIFGPGESNMTMLWANSIYGTNMAGFAFNSLGTATGVTYIKLGNGSESTGGSTFTGLRFSAKAGGYGIDARRGHELRVSDCLFHQTDTSGSGTAILIGNIVHGDYFGGWFDTNIFIGDWAYGIENRGTGMSVTRNGFNGPRDHVAFINWTAVVNVNGIAVTWVSGDPFDLTWPGFVEINGQIGLISTVNSTTSITLSNSLGVITGGQLRHGSTGQVQVEGNGFDSGVTWNQGGFTAAATLNSFYSFRIMNNMCTNWFNTTFTNCIFFGMPNARSVAITGNIIQNSVGTGAHFGINLTDIGDATITGNVLTGYTGAGIYANIGAANNPPINITGNKIKCDLAATAYGIQGAAAAFNISANTVEDCDVAYLIGAGGTGVISSPLYKGTITAKYQLNASSSMALQDFIGVAFADLAANAANGTMLYCTNCAPASVPCTGASTGAMAKRLNGAWACN